MAQKIIKLAAVFSSSILALSLSTAALAVPVTNYTFDFTQNGLEQNTANPDNAGNTWTYTDNSGAQTVSVTSWAETGDGWLNEATGHQMSAGLGVCNAAEAPANTCASNIKQSDNKRGIDNAGGHDWVLLLFTETMNFNTLTIAPETGSKDQKQGRDVTYFTGWMDSSDDVLNKTYAELTGTTYLDGLGLKQFNVDNGKSKELATFGFGDQTSTLGYQGEVWGNAILIGSSLINGNDRLLLNGISTVVPIPPAIWLFGSALSAVFIRRKKSSH